MTLGAFSMSLPVEDLTASRSFYETLGFGMIAGNPDEGWVILRCGDCTLGLFQGMFDKPMLTFNPGWVSEDETLDDFEDIRSIQARAKSEGLPIKGTEVDPASTGPASLTLIDPDGHVVFLDQHVPAPGSRSETKPS